MLTTRSAVPDTIAQRPARRSFPRTALFVLFGIALFAATAIGTGLLLDDSRSGKVRADDVPTADADYAVGFGHVDVESRVINLHPVQPGEIVEIPKSIRENADVKAGDILFRMDDQQAQFNLRMAEDALEDARLKLKQAQKMPDQHAALVRQQAAVLEAMKREKDKAEALYKKADRMFAGPTPLIGKEDRDAAFAGFKKAEEGVVIEQEKLDSMGLQLQQLRLDIDRALVDIKAKTTKRDQAKYALEKCVLRAPCKGTVLRLLVSVGDVLGPTPREPAVIFCPAQKRIIRTEIEQECGAKVHLGQSALIQDDARAAGEWRGKVVRISDWYLPRRSPLMEPRQFNDVRTLECIVELDDDKGLKIGQRVRVVLGK